MADLTQLDNIIARLRKVKYGDMILDSDHNDLVDAVTTIRDILKAGVGGAPANPSGVSPIDALKKAIQDAKNYWGFDLDRLRDYAVFTQGIYEAIDDITTFTKTFGGTEGYGIPEPLNYSTFGYPRPPPIVRGYPTYVQYYYYQQYAPPYNLLIRLACLRPINPVLPMRGAFLGGGIDKTQTPYDTIGIRYVLEINSNGIGIAVNDWLGKAVYTYQIYISQDKLVNWFIVAFLLHGRAYASPDGAYSIDRSIVVLVYDKNLNLLGTTKIALAGYNVSVTNFVTFDLILAQSEGLPMLSEEGQITTNLAFEFDWVLNSASYVEYEQPL